jgi:ketosteroid isomerase-like protein
VSQENVEAVQAFFDPLARGDLSRWFGEVTNDFVFVASPEVPDAGTYRGEDARRWITTWAESFEGYTVEATEFTDAGDKVVFEILQRGRPRGSQVMVEGRWWVLATLREGEIARIEIFPERAQAFDAAGLSE